MCLTSLAACLALAWVRAPLEPWRRQVYRVALIDILLVASRCACHLYITVFLRSVHLYITLFLRSVNITLFLRSVHLLHHTVSEVWCFPGRGGGRGQGPGDPPLWRHRPLSVLFWGRVWGLGRRH